MAADKNKNIEPDKALTKIEDDALGVSELAKRIATSIVRMSPHEGLVIGLYGKWGSGKTTFINFVKQSFASFKKEEQPIILHFNPWLFAGHKDLIQRYLIELSKLLAPTEHKLRKGRLGFSKKVGEIAFASEQLLTFAASLSGIPLAATSVKAISNLSRQAVKNLSEQKPLSEQKEEIENLLRKKDKKIFIIIDDIDRLEAREVLDIFRMVKSVADFPNVIYLLSFDRIQVSNIIKNSQNVDGIDYLEKIIQYDIDIPYPEHTGMLKLFGGRIDPTITVLSNKEWDTDRWSTLYMNYLRQRLHTPRQAVRLSNSFNIAYPALRGEVDPVDFLAIEALRMFHADIYYEIRRNQDKFTEFNKYSTDDKEAQSKESEYFGKIINMAPDTDQEDVKSILELLFPRVEKSFDSFLSDNDVFELRASTRIASNNHFGRYFSYTIMPHQFSEAEINEAIKLTTNLEEFESLVIGYSQQMTDQNISRTPEFLERLLDIIKAGQADSQLEEIIKAFIIIGDLIVRKEDLEKTGFIDISTDTRVLWIIRVSMERLTEKQNVFEILKNAMVDSKSIHISTMLLSYLGREHGKYNGKKKTIRSGQSPYTTLEQLKKLEEIILLNIEQAAKNNRLMDSLELLSILYRWRDITGSFDKPKEWVQKVSATDKGLTKLIIGFSSITTRYSGGKTQYILNVKSNYVEDFLGFEKNISRVQNLLKNDGLTEEERAALDAFIKSYENKKSGNIDDLD